MWLEKVCEVCFHSKQLDNLWNELLCYVLLYDVTCFVLVIVRIYVPSSRTDCNSGVSDYIDLHVILIVVVSYTTV